MPFIPYASFSSLVARVLGLLVPLLELAVEHLGEVRHVVDDDDVVLDLEGDLLVAPLDEVLEQVLLIFIIRPNSFDTAN